MRPNGEGKLSVVSAPKCRWIASRARGEWFAVSAQADVWLVLLLALALRLGVILGSLGGPRGYYGYDAGVYYAAADAFIHGRVPYAEFLLLHPPGIVLAVAPFAAVGRLTTDHAGFALANIVFAAMGAVNAVLVRQVASRLGCGRWAALLGGVFYAAWYGAINAEVGVRLEPLSNGAFLCGLLLITGRDQLSRRRALLAGAALGAAACVKIWWVVPLAVVLVWKLTRGGRRVEALWLAGGAAIAAISVVGPFVVKAPGPMWRMLITDQLGRGQGISIAARVDDLTGIGRTFPGLHGALHVVAVAVLVLLAPALITLAWQLPAVRLVVVIVVAQSVVLIIAPSYSPSYADYLAAMLAVTVATATQSVSQRPRAARHALRVVLGSGVAAVVASTAITLLARPNELVAPFPGQQLSRGVSHVRCITSDSPTVLIELDALSRALENNCPVLVDVTGLSLDVHAPSDVGVPLLQNRLWQADVRLYLLAGDAAILVRAARRLSPATIAAIYGHAVLVTADGRRVYALRRYRTR